MTAAIIARADARAQGLTQYFTGKACKHGHKSARNTQTGNCLECRRMSYRDDPHSHRMRQAKYVGDNREKVSARRKTAYKNNRDQRLADAKAYRLNNLETCRARDRELYHQNHAVEYLREWRAANADKVKAYAEEERQRNPGRVRAKYRRWYATEAGKAKAIETAHRRRARELDAPGTHTAADLKEILTAQGHRCAYCRADLRKRKKHLDHIKPLALGGSNGPNNLQWTCAPCNLSKGAADPITFAQSIGWLL